ncbi:4-oxalocrotonate tautomerase family protein [Streptomyces sp. NPDC050509]|uniref:4-oxalocrotonate tautomerase family protein n=1 Tax=Streptomyces sp. NPDC050509 TaxID=3365620 RepID=UPI0037ABC560
MTVITVNSPKGRLSAQQRRTPAETLTDAVLVPEVGQFAPAARVGFQVHFTEREPDAMAIGGRLLANTGPGERRVHRGEGKGDPHSARRLSRVRPTGRQRR